MLQWGLFGKLTVHGGPGILDTMALPHRIVWFSLSKALAGQTPEQAIGESDR